MTSQQREALTHQWLTPILISIIGGMIAYFLHSMDSKIGDIDTKVSKHIEKVESAFRDSSERYFKIEARVTRLEDHIIKP